MHNVCGFRGKDIVNGEEPVKGEKLVKLYEGAPGSQLCLLPWVRRSMVSTVR